MFAPVSAITASVVESSLKIPGGDLQPGRSGIVANQQVGQPERQIVERPGRTDPLVQQTLPARKVLDRGLDAPFEHLDHALLSRRYRLSDEVGNSARRQ